MRESTQPFILCTAVQARGKCDNPLQPAFASSRCSQVGTTRIVLFVRSKTDKNETKMGDEGDYAIEVADAGASATIPMEAGQIKKGG